MSETLKIVIVEDDQGLNELIKRRLTREKHECVCFHRAEEAVKWLADNDADLMLLDLVLPDYSGEELINMLKSNNIVIPFIVATGQGSEAMAVKMLKKGARDYLVKNSEFLNVLPSTVDMVWREVQLQHLLEKAREKIKGQNAILSAVHELSPDGIVVIDNFDQVVSYNKPLLDICGLDEASMTKDGEFFFRSVAEKVEDGDAFLKRNLELGGDENGLILNQVKLSNKYLEIHSRAMSDDDGKSLGRIWYFRDITLHKEAELAKEEARREAERNAMLRSQFFAVVSHDVKTPLNSIIGFINLLENSDLNQDQREYIEIIKSSGNHLVTLINDILDLTKIEHGSLELHFDSVEIRDLLNESVNTFIPVSREAEVTLKCDIADDVPKTIRSDYVRLKQIVINLLSNAMKFTRRGTVGLTCSKKGDKFIEIVITDTGMGISEDVQEYIFSPFSQGNAEIAQKYGGSGLGLAISKQLVERLGGEIHLESELKKGSTFSFTVAIA